MYLGANLLSARRCSPLARYAFPAGLVGRLLRLTPIDLGHFVRNYIRTNGLRRKKNRLRYLLSLLDVPVFAW
jgi:hypothetical protein